MASKGSESQSPKITLAELQQWRTRLPLTDLSATAKALYEMLQNCHQADLTAQERFEILSFLRPTLNYLSQGLQKFYANQDVLTDSQILTADLVYYLYREMLNGYKLVIEKSSNAILWRKKLLIAALHNAMYYCTKILFHSFEQHRTAPPGTWLDLNKLYLLAQAKKVAQKSLNKVVEWPSRFETLSDMYKHSLMFAIANPYRLRREEIIHLIYAIEAWAPLLSVQAVDEKSKPLYVINFSDDSGPKSTIYYEYSEDYYALNLDKVTDRIKKLIILQKAKDENKLIKNFAAAELALPLAFIESLYSMWRTLTQVNRTRKKTHGHISVCLGLSAAYWFINNSNSSGIFESSAPQSEQNEEIIEIDLLPEPLQSETKVATKHAYTVCEIVDESEGGYCLKWLQQDVSPQLQCGEIIGLEVEISPTQKIWSVGTIRWVKTEEDKSVLIGVQILSAEAIAVKARIAESSATQAVSALLLPEQPDKGKESMSLITPLLPFKVGTEVELEYNNQQYPVHLQKNEGLTACYLHFEIAFLSQHISFPYKLHPEQQSRTATRTS